MRAIVLLSLVLLFGSAQAQQMIYLQKGHELPYRKLSLGDHLAVKAGDEWIEGLITDIRPDRIALNKIEVLFSEITAYRTWNEMMRWGGTGLMIAGLGYLGLSTFNSLTNGDRPLLYGSEVAGWGSIAAGGWLMKYLSRKTYHREKGWELRVILPDIQDPRLAEPPN